MNSRVFPAQVAYIKHLAKKYKTTEGAVLREIIKEYSLKNK